MIYKWIVSNPNEFQTMCFVFGSLLIAVGVAFFVFVFVVLRLKDKKDKKDKISGDEEMETDNLCVIGMTANYLHANLGIKRAIHESIIPCGIKVYEMTPKNNIEISALVARDLLHGLISVDLMENNRGYVFDANEIGTCWAICRHNDKFTLTRMTYTNVI